MKRESNSKNGVQTSLLALFGQSNAPMTLKRNISHTGRGHDKPQVPIDINEDDTQTKRTVAIDVDQENSSKLVDVVQNVDYDVGRPLPGPSRIAPVSRKGSLRGRVVNKVPPKQVYSIFDRSKSSATAMSGVPQDADMTRTEVGFKRTLNNLQTFPESVSSQPTGGRGGPPMRSGTLTQNNELDSLQSGPNSISSDSLPISTSSLMKPLHVPEDDGSPSLSPDVHILRPSSPELPPTLISTPSHGTTTSFGSRHAPITIESSPVKPSAAEMGFFAPRKHKLATNGTVHSSQSIVVGGGVDAPFPSADCQHVTGPQKQFHVSPLPFKRFKRHARSPTIPTPILSLGTFPVASSSSQNDLHVSHFSVGHTPEHDVHFKEVPESHRRLYPAISRFNPQEQTAQSAQVPEVSQESWNEKWRPRRANEVLGNESSSEFLKAWLLALAVQAPTQLDLTGSGAHNAEKGNEGSKRLAKAKLEKAAKRPVIIRAVKKPKGRPRKRRRLSDDEDNLDWIVSDDSNESELEQEDERMDWERLDRGNNDDEEDNNGSDSSRPQLTRLFRGHPPGSEDAAMNVAKDSSFQDLMPPASSISHDFGSYLTNNILLSGPQGTGKSAAVYACAEELGWEVFEVYPGIGKRSGANLVTLVGDVGKNHIVGRVASRVHLSSGSADNVRKEVVVPQGILNLGNNNSKAKGKQTLTSLLSMDQTKPGEMKKHLVKTGVVSERVDPRKIISQPSPRELAATKDMNYAFFPSQKSSTDLEPASSEDPLPSSSLTPKQSIILLEEVDILYNEDANFWPTVIHLVKNSRRPVVMTCNDPMLVPISDLPLQTVLLFEPCPSPLASSYLHCMALKEGYLVSRNDLATLYESTHPLNALDVSEDLFYSSSKHPMPVPDMRRAVNSLQFLCQSGSCDSINSASNINAAGYCSTYRNLVDSDGLTDWSLSHVQSPRNRGSKEEKLLLMDLHSLNRFTEAVSVIDGQLRHRPLSILDAFTVDKPHQSQDDELGYSKLCNVWIPSDFDGGIPFYNWDDAIACEAVRTARRTFDTGNEGSQLRAAVGARSEARSSRAHFLRQIVDVLDNIVPEAICALHQPSIFLNYEPWVRNMVAADDLMEQAILNANQATARGGRMTRNSRRQDYVRYVSLHDDQRASLRSTAFRVDDTFSVLDEDRECPY